MSKPWLLFVLFGLVLDAKDMLMHTDSRILSHIVDQKKNNLEFYLKGKNKSVYKTFTALKGDLKQENQELLFAMNGGMYMENYMPLGLYVENSKVLRKANRVQNAYGNFYMQPNGVFFITKSKNAYVKQTKDFHFKSYVDFATQSGPMLVINNKLHPKFKQDSKYFHIRNGVGVLRDGKVLFAISKVPITFYDFAMFFKKNGCKNALYLDGAVSDIYLPPNRTGRTYSRFGVIIAETKSN